jgi:DNA-binding transcriptional ArsR family regulator
MSRHRLDFASADAAGYGQMQEQWRRAASGADLSKVGHRLASLLPDYINRQYGYAFPTDEQLAEIIGNTPRTVGRGMKALEEAGLIERLTIVRRDEKGEAIGKLRRIYLTLPKAGERIVRGERTEVNGQSEVNGQNRVGERTTYVRIPSDSNTLSREKNSKTVSVEREDCPFTYRGDDAFLDEFDRAALDLAGGRALAAGELSGLVQEAFDRTTDSSDLFMPFHWRDVCKLRSRATEEWFVRRAGQVLRARLSA